jgi:hypothetical protein
MYTTRRLALEIELDSSDINTSWFNISPSSWWAREKGLAVCSPWGMAVFKARQGVGAAPAE